MTPFKNAGFSYCCHQSLLNISCLSHSISYECAGSEQIHDDEYVIFLLQSISTVFAYYAQARMTGLCFYIMPLKSKKPNLEGTKAAITGQH